MSTSPRPELAAVDPCVHGSLSDPAREALGLGAVLDFSASCNPLGASPSALRALVGVDPARYPDDGCLALRRALAGHLRVPPEGIVAGNGSVELIYLLAAAYLRHGDHVLVVGPTFCEYARAAGVQGATVAYWEAREELGFVPDPAGIARAVAELRPRLVFLCNPNNPTGAYLRRAAMEAILAACRESLLVVDEAYLPFVEDADSLLDLVSEDLVLLRSLTKDHGLAGLRLGYAVAAPSVAQALAKVKMPWSVSVAAQAAGLAALSDAEHVARGRAEVGAAKDYLTREMRRLGLPVLPSAANFLLVDVGDGGAFRDALLRRGCCLRDCASFGLPRYVRIGMRPVGECRRLVEAIEEHLRGC